MTAKSLAKKAIKSITGRCFTVSASTSSGAVCDGGWDSSDAGYLDLNKAEMLGHIKLALESESSINSLIDVEELFKGLKTKSIDIEEALNEIAYEAAYPEGGPRGTVTEYVPRELESLVDDIMDLDQDDEDYEASAASVREKLKAVKSGTYTIRADVSDADGLYMYAEDSELSIKLSAQKARGLLYDYCDNESISIDSLFEGIDYKYTDEDDIQGIVDDMDFSEYADGATGECEALQNFTKSWCQFIYAILTQKVTDDIFDDCLCFFDEADFEDETEGDFDNWFEDYKENLEELEEE